MGSIPFKWVAWAEHTWQELQRWVLNNAYFSLRLPLLHLKNLNGSAFWQIPLTDLHKIILDYIRKQHFYLL